MEDNMCDTCDYNKTDPEKKPCSTCFDWVEGYLEARNYEPESVKGAVVLTLDEAIKHCEEKANELGGCDCGNEHLQLAQWLKELKELKEE
jgi:hypothetical protein